MAEVHYNFKNNLKFHQTLVFFNALFCQKLIGKKGGGEKGTYCKAALNRFITKSQCKMDDKSIEENTILPSPS